MERGSPRRRPFHAPQLHVTEYHVIFRATFSVGRFVVAVVVLRRLRGLTARRASRTGRQGVWTRSGAGHAGACTYSVLLPPGRMTRHAREVGPSGMPGAASAHRAKQR